MLEEVEEQITKEQWKSDLKHANCFGFSPASPSQGQARHCIFNRLYAPVQEIISCVITSRNRTSTLKDIADKHLKLVKSSSTRKSQKVNMIRIIGGSSTRSVIISDGNSFRMVERSNSKSYYKI